MSLLVAVLVAAAMARPAAAAPRVAFGAYHPGAPGSRSAMDELTQLAGRRPVVWLTYRMWGETPVPHDMMRTVDAAGGVASVTWHPENAGLRAIAGGRHDAYIKSSARDAASWGKPVFIRFGAEMNGGWFPWGLGVNGNTAGDFIAPWGPRVRLFRDPG